MLLYTYTALSIDTPNDNVTASSGQNVIFECTPSDDDIKLYWTYQTVNTNGTVTSTNISQSIYLTNSPLFHRLTLPIATINDTGYYTCFVQEFSEGNVTFSQTFSQTISLTVLPG